jgi:hypothetical protein
MGPDMEINVLRDTATAAVSDLRHKITSEQLKKRVGNDCVELTQEHLKALDPNKNNWPTTGFYAGAADGTDFDILDDGILIYVDNKNAKGAMRQRFHGGTINKRDKMLTIPARAEFYGMKATDFTNLRLAIFGRGVLALVIGEGGTGKVNFRTGKERAVAGASSRQASMVAFWLRDSVHQDPDPDVIPTRSQYVGTAIDSIMELIKE